MFWILLLWLHAAIERARPRETADPLARLGKWCPGSKALLSSLQRDP